MTQKTNEVLAALASEWGVHDLVGLSDEDLEIVAIRLITETGDTPTAGALRKIAREVKASAAGVHSAADGGRRSGQAKATVSIHNDLLAEEPALRRPRYFKTKATMQAELREKDRLATVHRIEDARTGLFLAPRRPRKPLGPFAVHPACKAAQADGAQPCARCVPLLHPATCDCAICDEWWAVQE